MGKEFSLPSGTLPCQQTQQNDMRKGTLGSGLMGVEGVMPH